MPVIGLLGIAFIVLKLMELIDWEWWLVLSPFWGGAALLLGLMAVVGTGILGFFGAEAVFKRFTR